MARVTIEDCLKKVEDRFELVGLAAQRARDIASGSELTIERNGEKDTVIALREIANGNVDIPTLREEYITSFEVERAPLESFINSANDSDSLDSEGIDSISIDEEEADIRAAINSASEANESAGFVDAAPEGFGFDEQAEEALIADGVDGSDDDLEEEE